MLLRNVSSDNLTSEKGVSSFLFYFDSLVFVLTSCLQLRLPHLKNLLRRVQRPTHHPEDFQPHQKLQWRRLLPEDVRWSPDRPRARRYHGIRQQPGRPPIRELVWEPRTPPPPVHAEDRHSCRSVAVPLIRLCFL